MPALRRTVKTMRLADDVVPLSTFRKNMASCLARISKTHRPLLITQNGVASKIVLDVADFDAIRETFELVDDVWAAEAELAARRGIKHAGLKRRVATEAERAFGELSL